jgi:hypothetical protein
VLNTKDLKQMALAEMANVSHNPKDGTKKLEREIGLTIEKLHSQGKLSDQEKKDLKPSDSVAPASWPAIKHTNLKKTIQPGMSSATLVTPKKP